MRFGASFFMQNYGDWGRYAERGYDRAPARTDRQVYDEDVRLASLVEPLGFDSIWTVEHHFTPYTMVPNPLQFLTFMAGRTERVDFGTMVVVLPWHDPLRVAEEIAMLDMLAGGRKLTLGFGRGAGRVEFDGMRVPMGESRDRFLESLEMVRLALASRSSPSRAGSIRSRRCRSGPSPARRTSSTGCTAPGAAPRPSPSPQTPGLGPLFIPQKSWEEIGEEVVDVQRHPRRAGLGAAGADRRVLGLLPPRREEAWETARQYMTNYNDSALRHYEFGDAEHFKEAGGYDFYAKMAEARKGARGKGRRVVRPPPGVGHPRTVHREAAPIRATTGAAEFVGVFTYGDLPVGAGRGEHAPVRPRGAARGPGRRARHRRRRLSEAREHDRASASEPGSDGVRGRSPRRHERLTLGCGATSNSTCSTGWSPMSRPTLATWAPPCANARSVTTSTPPGSPTSGPRCSLRHPSSSATPPSSPSPAVGSHRTTPAYPWWSPEEMTARSGPSSTSAATVATSWPTAAAARRAG